jgi:hypothetical protein
MTAVKSLKKKKIEKNSTQRNAYVGKTSMEMFKECIRIFMESLRKFT